MPRYRCIRDCYFIDRYYEADKIYDFEEGDDVPHHFIPVGKKVPVEKRPRRPDPRLLRKKFDWLKEKYPEAYEKLDKRKKPNKIDLVFAIMDSEGIVPPEPDKGKTMVEHIQEKRERIASGKPA